MAYNAALLHFFIVISARYAANFSRFDVKTD